jgi:hypothetical protein
MKIDLRLAQQVAPNSVRALQPLRNANPDRHQADRSGVTIGENATGHSGPRFLPLRSPSFPLAQRTGPGTLWVAVRG